jgi:hypothetical protein
MTVELVSRPAIGPMVDPFGRHVMQFTGPWTPLRQVISSGSQAALSWSRQAMVASRAITTRLCLRENFAGRLARLFSLEGLRRDGHGWA